MIKEKGAVHLVPILIVLAVVALIGWTVYQKSPLTDIFPFLKGKIGVTCDPLTLVSLKQVYDASGIAPVSGEKCTISSDDYLLKLVYQNNTQAQKAKFSLMLETTGDKKQIEGASLIIHEGNSSAFFVEGSTLKVLVMLKTTDEAKIKGMVLGFKDNKDNSSTQDKTQKDSDKTQGETEKSTNIFNVREEAADNIIKSDMNQLKIAMELYFTEKEVYPKTLEELVKANIIKTVPLNPKTNKPYDFTSNGKSYTISTTLNDGSQYKISRED
ncbi:hypothetical protein KKE78_03605 [Patescibacteria group bacterium]|nr:hypothetical protein [Patescibacteria group bacterium]